MSRTITTEVFKYEELDERAQSKARDWFRQVSAGDEFYAESVIETAAEAAQLLGLDIRTRSVKLMNGGSRLDPCVYYSGFSSQGDGACFEGTWRAADMQLAELVGEFPRDAELQRIGTALAAIAKDYPDASFGTKHTGRYSHAYSMTIDTDCGIDDSDEIVPDARVDGFPEDDLKELARDFAHWIYSSLEAEWEYTNSDAVVAENIICNEYEFTIEGERA